MIARHVHRPGTLRRAWAPLGHDLLKDPVSVPEYRPIPGLVAELRNQMTRDLVEEVRRGPLPLGTAKRNSFEVQDFLAPRRTPAKAVAHGIRQFVGHGMFAVSFLVAVAVPPVLYAVGV